MPSKRRARPRLRSYRDLEVWREGMDLVVDSYQISRKLPHYELYGLTSQIRRAAVSVPTNIAEGHGRNHLGDYIRHLSVANGSLMELETLFIASARLGYLKATEWSGAMNRAAKVGRMLSGLMRKLAALKAQAGPHTRYPAPDTRHPADAL